MAADLQAVLEEARELGFLGPGPVDGHIEHAKGFLQAVGAELPRRVIDLGSGAGLPGLVLAMAWPRIPVVLLDSSERRTLFLARAADELGISTHVVVARARAEEAGRDPDWRARADLVVARSFGPPAVTAECAAPLLEVGGRLIVSEPPEEGGSRWPEEGLAPLGLRPTGRFEQAFCRFQVLRQETLCAEDFPRRVGVPEKRPLFSS
ncbi:MAG TPA: RsmG family class I SAM-dependent methyltransferase [Acidimicrobiales bacterium]|nr:RsmG family class I SAM-dependent methyltransferase [Acidimicrobiales bacterium]